MSRILTDDQLALRDKVRTFARDVVGPRRSEATDDPSFLKEMNRLMGEAGILRTFAPKSLGGDEMGVMAIVIVMEELARESPAVAMSAMMQMNIPVNMVKTPPVADRWARSALAGETTVSFASTDPVGYANYTEHPDIGRCEGDEFVLNGVRHFAGQAIFADVIGVSGLVDGDMHLFWIPADQAGVQVSPMPKMGIGAPWGRVELTDVRVPAEYVRDMSVLVKDRQLVDVSGTSKVSTHPISALALGLAEGVWEKTDAYLRARTVRNEPLASLQALQHKLVRMRQNIEAGRSMLYDATQLVDAGQGDAVLDHLLKPFLTEMAFDVATTCMTLHGGRGYERAAGIEIYLRDAAGLLIGECTADMHYSTVANLLNMPGALPGSP
ncbi:acyl-CoA dehydrogenase, N-terminal domain protein [Pseudarthrobacter siccitolerans]|uniref:Acyl-CoA dehydrogenase, N-terminal domain protein n=1 Tax=Pseudarthrobacter siccitolerans TaxID=861266 RepID=A0A024H7M0_9MICC|nr:acyl-CoA dehydrogenase family protein [Pseudarthrobacter siccitolerans]CCQ48160.1 acyl-CoA dehydrogenase, N-terminal domain protein [Pseudarthrobacter siccitolerans]